MPISGWFVLVFVVITTLCVCFALAEYLNSGVASVVLCVIFFVISIGSYGFLNWYYTETASGQRAVIDERSDFSGGLERTVNILNADGKIIKSYTGIIDIEDNDGGYVIFDLDGKRYMYFNCYVESIAEIGG